MATRMLIDATHAEETRVVVVKGTRLEEFDFETSTKKTLKGNIYLAKVTRVEPSLQAAFVEYGGNRHGFLAFSEIHPDYYQIPVADRRALLARQAAEEAKEEAEEAEEDTAIDDQAADTPPPPPPEEIHHDESNVPEELPAGESFSFETQGGSAAPSTEPDVMAEPWTGDTLGNETPVDPQSDRPAMAETTGAGPDVLAGEAMPLPDDMARASATEPDESNSDIAGGASRDDGPAAAAADNAGEVVSIGGDAIDEARPPRRRPSFRHYKIQEVIKRRQIILVQVVKEERGNKGAALTTYLSLAGRYCVLMPNTARGGGVSRKIASPADRKRLKSIASELEVPDGMGVIVRTAGMERSKPEIKRDFEFLLRTWDSIREFTLSSSAPCLVYEEANLIKRAIRDLYIKDIDEILVEGDDGYRAAKDFMKMLMPSHAKRVQPYRDRIPLFHRFQVEHQFDGMYSPTVQLKSGGYIVINPTEALVSIDVNSGKSTREHNIEETAYKTNLEAADEISRQLRLRDLAGLIVIDLIDMEDQRNNRNVERRLKECLKADRARIQVGRISAFGLLEMSRQRLRPSLLESSTQLCPHCQGRGYVRSTESTALYVLRAIEDEGIRERSAEIVVHIASAVAIYLLNFKRDALADIERRYGLKAVIAADDSLVPPEHRIDRVKAREAGAPRREEPRAAITSEMANIETMEDAPEAFASEPDAEVAAEVEAEVEIETSGRETPSPQAPSAPPRERTGDGEHKRRRRGRRRPGQRPEAEPIPMALGEFEHPGAAILAAHAAGDVAVPESERESESSDTDERDRPAPAPGENGGQRRRRRGRRGGRRHRRPNQGERTPAAVADQAGGDASAVADFTADSAAAAHDPGTGAVPFVYPSADTMPDCPAVETYPRQPDAKSEPPPAAPEPVAPSQPPEEPVMVSAIDAELPAPAASPKRGWWRRR